MIAAATAVSPRTVSPAMTELSASTFHYAHWAIYNTLPAVDRSYDMDDEDTNALQSGYLTFS